MSPTPSTAKVSQGDAMELAVMIFTHNIIAADICHQPFTHNCCRICPPSRRLRDTSLCGAPNDGQQMCGGVTARFINLSGRADQSSIDSMDVDFFPIEICHAPLTTRSPTSRTFDFYLIPFSDPMKNVSILIWNSCNQYWSQIDHS